MTVQDNESSVVEENEYIQRFAQRIIRERSGNYKPLKRSIDGSLIYMKSSGIPTNRGNKLLQDAEFVTRDRLDTKSTNEDVVYYNGSEHNLLQRRNKKMRFFPKSTIDGINIKPEDKHEEETIEAEEAEEELDLNKLVNVRDILTPISSLADVSQKESVSRTFKNPILQNLSLQAILMIEKEQDSVAKYSRLLEVFLGEYCEPLIEKNLKLEDYDHNLSLPEEVGTSTTSDNNTEGMNKPTSTPPRQADPTREEINDESPEQNDPFFALPSISPTDGITALLDGVETPEVLEQMETTRQMAQIALQRNEEFIRNLKKIRCYLDKASRIRERILSWSKEYAGIQEDGVTIPTALRVVKRGLISATTNKTMLRVEEGEADNEELEQ